MHVKEVQLVVLLVTIIVISSCYYVQYLNRVLFHACQNHTEIFPTVSLAATATHWQQVDLDLNQTDKYKAHCNLLYEKRTIPVWRRFQAILKEKGYETLTCDNAESSNTIIPYRIFQIGFHRVGTNSLKEFFSKNSYGSAHYLCKHNCSLDSNLKQMCDMIPCFRLMQNNLIHSRLLLDGFCHEYVYYGDFGISPMIHDIKNPSGYLDYDVQFDMLHDKYKYFWFELLDKQYPCSKFILNIRSVDEWLISRSEHRAKYGRNVYVNRYWQLHSFFYFRPLKDRNQTNWQTDLSKQEVLQYWKQDWYWYNCHVINYFKTRNRMSDLLIFDVANDDTQKLIHFFKDIRMNLDREHWKHINWKHNHSTSNQGPSETETLMQMCDMT